MVNDLIGFETKLKNFHFHGDDSKRSEELLEECDTIHFLHQNYHKREHLWKHKDKWGIIFVHGEYLPDMLKYGDSVKQFNTNVNEDDFLELLHHCRKKEFGLEIIHHNYTKIFQKNLYSN